MKSQKNDKRVRRPLLWLLVLLSLLLVPTGSLAENALSLKLETAAVSPGSQVQIPITIQSNTGIASLKMSISYDDEILTLTNVAVPQNSGAYSSVPQPYSSNQIINFVSPLSAFSKTGVFATLTFSVNPNADMNKVSDIIVEYDEDDIFDMNFNTVPFVSVNGAVLVSDSSSDSLAVLPALLTKVTEESFMNTSFYYVVLPETTTSIESKAFANCGHLTYIYIPESTTQIADNAFLNVTNLTIYGKQGSYAETYARNKGYNFQAR